MTAHECLVHSWLTGDNSHRTNPINTNKYINFRNKIRAKYDDWKKYVLPIGRLAEYSSLRKLLIEKYKIQDTTFGTCKYNISTNKYIIFIPLRYMQTILVYQHFLYLLLFLQ
jgi:hypothetical protein